MVTMEMKSRRTDQNVMNPRMPTLMETMLKETQRLATGSGMRISETMTTANPAQAIEDSVPGRTALYCSANWK
uniref:Uncharacterized protein n=1 Tax=Caenorhabditis japonica TaxID=281687 RepID=A0A8R1ETI3_CAEJA